jgi:site-specific DNA recombinase
MLMSKELTKCAIYLRVSTAQQVEHGQSLDVQKHQLIARAISDGYNEEDILIFEDPGISGSKFENRPEILNLIERIQSKDNDIGKIYSFKLDRISRSTHEIHWFINLCSECGVHYVSLKDGIDTSNPTLGKILVTVFGLVSELELENIKIRTSESRLKRYREGKSLGGMYVSLGYKRLNDKRGRTYFEIVEEEADVIRYIFNSYANGVSKTDIIAYLNENGYKTRANNPFIKSSIDRILNNPIYVGKIRYNNPERNKRRNKDAPILVDGLHEPIITKDIWDRVQRRINRNKITVTRNFEDYLFSSKIICAKCGSKLYGKRTGLVNKKDNRRHTYYKCFNNDCKTKALRVDLSDKMLLRILLSVINSVKFSDFIKEVLIKEIYKTVNDVADVVNVKEEIQSLEQRQNNLIEQYAFGLIDEYMYTKALNIVNDKLSDLKTKASEMDNVNYDIDKNIEENINADITNFISNLNNLIKSEDKKQKIEIINELVNTVMFIDIKTGKADLKLNFTTDLFLMNTGNNRKGDYESISFHYTYEHK